MNLEAKYEGYGVVTFFKSGNVERNQFKNGLTHGFSQYIESTVGITIEGTCKNGKEIGEFIATTKEGRIKYITMYCDGVIASVKELP